MAFDQYKTLLRIWLWQLQRMTGQRCLLEIFSLLCQEIDWTNDRLLREAISLSRPSILLCLRLSCAAFLPGQTRVCGNDKTDDSSDTSGRHLNTELTICVRCSKVKLNPLASFHRGLERQMAQTWHNVTSILNRFQLGTVTKL